MKIIEILGLSITAVVAIIGVVMFVIAVAIVTVIITVTNKKRANAKSTQTVNVQQVNESPPIDKNMQLVIDGIRTTASSFNGLYEGVYQAVTNPAAADSDTLDEWIIRVRNMNYNNDFTNAFLTLFYSGPASIDLKYRNLLTCIQLAGIQRSDASEYYYEPNGIKKYICLSDKTLADGTLCTVLKPYWYADTKILEQGCIIRKDV